ERVIGDAVDVDITVPMEITFSVWSEMRIGFIFQLTPTGVVDPMAQLLTLSEKVPKLLQQTVSGHLLISTERAYFEKTKDVFLLFLPESMLWS
ncbi:hypothetical protein SK128_027987, partial [Halocaridina rubra]